MDLYYVDHRSLALDAQILWWTAKACLGRSAEVYEQRYSRECETEIASQR